MNQIFTTPDMVTEARKSGRGYLVFGEFFRYILVYLIISVVVGFVSSFALSLSLAGNDAFWIALRETDPQKMAEALNLLMQSYTEAAPVWYQILNLFLTSVTVITVLIYCTKFEKRGVKTLGLRRGGLGEYLVGLVAGVAVFGAALGICSAMGTVAVSVTAKDTFPSVAVIVLFFVGYMIQGFSEELLCRGYLMVSVSRKHSVVFGAVFSSAIFAVMHLSNNGITVLSVVNLFLFGIFGALYVTKRGNLWGIAGFHTAWNFAQGNIFGISVSGNALSPSLFTSVIDPTRASVNGGTFGLEGGGAVTIVLAVAILLLSLTPPNPGEHTLKRETADTQENQ